ncbi:MAG: DUF6242 domain-containing protein [Prevotellaceae bacterium]|jgi:hypothetical protein|nr:DUF6242 domain-containing protein [Prevotellaceae bacterium]
MLKNKILFTALIAVSVVFSACINTDGVELSSNANVISFSLKTGTSATFPSTTFKIDTTKNNESIYSVDSLPYLTRIDSLVPVIGTSSASEIKIIVLATADTLTYSSTKTDTIDFSDTVKITVVPQNKDRKKAKTFKVVLKVHQADPNLYVWTPQKSEIYSENSIAEKMIFFNNGLNLFVKNSSNVVKLYTSENGKNWSEKTLTGFPNDFDIKYITKNADKLYIAENKKVYVSSDGISWTEHSANKDANHILFALNNTIFGVSGNTLLMLDTTQTEFLWSRDLDLPLKFPVEGEGICVATATAGNERAYIIGGKDVDGNLLNSVWSTENGVHWANLASKNLFSVRQDVAVMQYDNLLLLFGGRDNSGVLGLSDYFVISPDYGVSWRTPYDNMAMPLDLMPRFACQFAVNDNKTIIYLVGGQNDSGFVKDAWTGVRNEHLWENAE